MEDAAESFEVVPSEGSEQSPASSQGQAVGEAEDPAEQPLLPESAGTAQSEEDCDQQSPQNSVLPENTANETETVKEVVKMLGMNGLKRYFFLQFGYSFLHLHTPSFCLYLLGFGPAVTF